MNNMEIIIAITMMTPFIIIAALIIIGGLSHKHQIKRELKRED